MEKRNVTVQRYIPWYSDDYRVSSKLSDKKDYMALSPRDIYTELTSSIAGQDDACRKVAVMMYQHLRGHRFVGLLAGPTGSGKSFIAENLKKLFPKIVYMRDISNVTNDGWSGSKKVISLFRGIEYPETHDTEYEPVIFLDECDKLFTPKVSSSGENVSESVQAEFLSVIQGCEIGLAPGDDRCRTDVISTSGISFLFAGAFDKKAREIAEKESGPKMGFGSGGQKSVPYDREIGRKEIMEAGCISELCGRIQKIVNLNPVSEDTFRMMLDETDRGPVHELMEEFCIPISISNARKDEMAHEAFQSGLGIRGIKNMLREYIDDMVWNDCGSKVLEIA